ncbi:MAG TPA: hypothetical protein VN228_13005 [Pyrinomonadaceae bacterium]|nr:hypothetical protein [Pyrinomonadaceae bacterium]
MSDYNDFFDDMIDVDDETEAEATQYFDDDEGDEDEDDDSSVVRTAVLTKNGLIALLSLKAGDAGGQIVRYDPREALPAVQRYESEREARKWFGRSLATSRRNGWQVVYDGVPLAG